MAGAGECASGWSAMMVSACKPFSPALVAPMSQHAGDDCLLRRIPAPPAGALICLSKASAGAGIFDAQRA